MAMTARLLGLGLAVAAGVLLLAAWGPQGWLRLVMGWVS